MMHDARRDILVLHLREGPGSTTAELARAIEVTPCGGQKVVRAELERMERAGLVQRRRTGSEPWRWQLTEDAGIGGAP